LDPDLGAALAGFVIGFALTLGGTYIAWRADQLRRAMRGREGSMLMSILSRMITIMVLAMWVGLLRQALAIIDNDGTVIARTILQVIASLMFLGAIVWALVQVRGFDNRTSDLEEEVRRVRDQPSRLKIELDQLDRILGGNS